MQRPDRRLRADAARNRELLIAAADKEFGEQGLGASVAAITERAGVAKGTFFRHFATKEDLLAAIVTQHVTALIEAGDGLLDADDPGEALLDFLTIAAAQRQQHDVSFLLRAGQSDNRVVEVRDRLYSTIGTLADRARASGALRPDVSATDVVVLMCAPNHVVEYVKDPDPQLWRRYLAIIFDGLRPQGAHPLPHPAPVEPA